MIENGLNIKGFVKYKGDFNIENFYDSNRFKNTRVDREFLTKLINIHIGYVKEESKNPFDGILKVPVLYRFEVRKYINGNLRYFKNTAFVKNGVFEWKILSRQTKTYNEKYDILMSNP